MKKLSLCLALVLLLSLFAACGGGQPASTPQESAASTAAEPSQPAAAGEKIPLSLWFWGSNTEQQKVMQEVLIDKFNAENPEYELTVEYRDSVNQDIAVALAANQGPDIVYESAPSMAINYILAGKYADLTEYDQQYGWKDKLIQPMYESCTVEGKLYSIPNGIHVIGMVYNKRVLDENGWQVPTTLDQLTAIMDEAIAKGMYGSVTGNAGWKPTNQDYASLFLTNFSGPMEVYKCLNGEQPWNSPNLVYGVQQSAEWYQKGYLGGDDYLSLGWGESAQLLADGRAPFFFGPLKFIQNLMPFAAGENADDFQFTVFPSGREGVQPAYATGTSSIFAINANTPHKDVCAKFLNMIMEQDYVIEMAKRWPGYWGVPLKTLGEIDPAQFEGLSKTFMNAIIDATKVIADGNFGYDCSTYFPPETYLQFENIDTVWFGDQTAEQLLAATDPIFEREKADGLVPPIPKPAG